VAWTAATSCSGVACTSSYYGGGIHASKDATAKCPAQFHFGDKDGGIPLGNVHEIKEAQPDIPTYVYDDAAHGFCCDERDSFNAGACERARERTLALLAANVG
jgi:carboxymethylenebutenolidase